MFVKKRNLIAYAHENEEAILLEKFLLLFLTVWWAWGNGSAEEDSSLAESLRWAHCPLPHAPPLQAGAGVSARSVQNHLFSLKYKCL